MKPILLAFPLLLSIAACQPGEKSDAPKLPVGTSCSSATQCVEGATCTAGVCEGAARVSGRVFLNGSTIDAPLTVGLFPLHNDLAVGLRPSEAVVNVTYSVADDPQDFTLEKAPTGERLLVAYWISTSQPAGFRVVFGSALAEIRDFGVVYVDGRQVDSIDIYISGQTALLE